MLKNSEGAQQGVETAWPLWLGQGPQSLLSGVSVVLQQVKRQTAAGSKHKHYCVSA